MSHERSPIDGDHLRSHIAGDSESVVGIEESGRVAFATPAAARRLGYEVADLVETPTRRLFVENRDGAALDRIASFATDWLEEPTVEFTFRHRDGGTVTLDGTVERVDHDGSRIVVLVFDDGEHDRGPAGHDPGGAGLAGGDTREREPTDTVDAADAVPDDDDTAEAETDDLPAYTVGMFREVFDHLDDALLVTDPDSGVLKACSAAACDLLGYDREELLALSPDAVLHSEDGSVEELVHAVRERGTGWTDELVCRTASGVERPIEVSVVVVDFDGEARMLWNLRDRTDRLERERTLRQQVAAMESAIDGMTIVDTSGTYVYVNQAHAEMHGYDTAEELVGESWQHCYDDAARARHEREVLPALDRDGYWRGESVGQRADGSTFEQDLSLATVDGGSIVGVVRDISDRKAAERQLQALNRVNRDLLSAESDREIAERCIDTVERVVGFDVCCVRLFDRESNEFDIVALTAEADRLMRSRRAFKLRSTHAARAYRRGETVLETEPVDADGPDGEEPIRASLHVPLGEYGVVSVLTTGEDSISDRSASLVDLLASDVTMVFEHTRRERLLCDHERELLLQRDRLRALDQINGVIREIIQRLPKATTDEEIVDIVCRCLADSPLYRAAWIVEAGGGSVSVPTDADGGEDEDEESGEVSEWSDPPRLSGDVLVETVETGTIQVTQYSVTQNGPESDEERTAFEAVMTVPVPQGGRVEEVLVVTTGRTDAFSEPERAEFELLGEMIGFVLSSIATRKLLIADTVLELDFAVAAGDDVFVDLSERFHCVCTVEESVPLRGRRLLQYATVEGTAPERAYEFASDHDGVETRRLLDQHDESGLFELVVTASPVTDLIDLGASVQSLVADDGTGRLVVEAPSGVDIRTLVDVLGTHYERVELVAKHERPRHVETSFHFVDALDEWLTDRQHTALRAAYAAGYYDWPRKSTAEEVAASLDITSATLHQHLRKAEEKLLRAYLGDDGDS